jgi:rubrerythrin
MKKRSADYRSDGVCPSCGSPERVPIAYGLPTQEAVERANRGEFTLGGCLVDDQAPRWQCRVCGTKWGRLRDVG